MKNFFKKLAIPVIMMMAFAFTSYAATTVIKVPAGGTGFSSAAINGVVYNGASTNGPLATDSNFIWDPIPRVLYAGDPNGTSNGTLFALSDSSQTIDLNTNQLSFGSPAGGRIMGRLTASTGLISFGDVSALGNENLFSISDFTGETISTVATRFQIDRAGSNDRIFAANFSPWTVAMGDLDAAANSTIFEVDDANSQMNFQADNLFLFRNTSNETSFTLNPSTYSAAIGDLSLAGNGTQFEINDGTSTIRNTTAGQFIIDSVIGQQFFNINNATRLGQLGDVGNAVNGTLLSVNDTAETIDLDTDGIVSMGDVSSTGNDTTFVINDNLELALLTTDLGFASRDSAGNFWYQLLPGFHAQSMGDLSNNFNSTLFQVDDLNRQINSQAIIAGTGGNSQVSATGSRIQYSTAGTTWGFVASNSGGGAAIITANNQNYKWPDTDGDAGDVLTTDGSGVLSFESGTTTEKVTIASADILTLNGTPVELIPAPGAGKAIQVISVTGRLNFVTVAYATNIDLLIRDDVSGTGLFADGVLGSGTLLPSVATRLGQVPPLYSSGAAVISENSAIEILAPVGNPTAGDGTLDIYITYKIITL